MGFVVDVLLPLSLAFIMFTLGVGLVLDDFRRVAQQPLGFALGALGQLVVLPAVAFGLIYLFGFTGGMAVGIMILALSPGGVTSNLLSKFAKGNVALSVSLTAIMTLVVVVTIPLILGPVMRIFSYTPAHGYSALATGLSIFALVVVPVFAGMAVRARASVWALRQQRVLLSLIHI